MSRIRRRHLALLCILLAAYALRLQLLQNEGQFRFSDEVRYKPAALAAGDLYQGKFAEVLGRLLRYSVHPGFKIVGIIPAYIHRVTWEYAPTSPVHWDTYRSWNEYWTDGYGDFRFSAALFAIPSVAVILMVFLLARQIGAGADEALLAAFLLAASNTMFMYSQHFLPYDTTLLIALLALSLAIHCRDRAVWRAIPVGMLAFLTFWIYNGYFSLCLMLALVYCAYLAPNLRIGALRFLGMAVGSLALFLPLYLLNWFAFDIDIIEALTHFSASVHQGDFNDGIVVPFEYFAHAEQGMALVWLAGLALAGWKLRTIRRKADRQRLLLWLVCLLFLYAIMALLSNGLNRFVVYGRTARTLAPFIVLICAFAYRPVIGLLPRYAKALFLVGVAALALISFVPMMNQVQFRLFQREVYANYDDVSYESMFGGDVTAYGVRGPYRDSARYKLLNAGIFYPINEIFERPAGEIVMEVEYFYRARAWQYEGLSGKARDLINSSDIKMWLIDTQDASD